jgi:small-conductance mechanosensitive channel
VSLQVTVPLTADLQQVENIAREVAEEVWQKLLRDKVGTKKHKELIPLVRYLSYGDASINLAIQLPFPVSLDAGLVRHELFKALHTRFMAQNISLPFPQSVVHLQFLDDHRPKINAAVEG